MEENVLKEENGAEIKSENEVKVESTPVKSENDAPMETETNLPELIPDTTPKQEKMDENQISGHGVEKGHFTSEIYKIELSPIPKMIGYGDLKNFLLKKHKVLAHKIKYIRHYRKCYICFKNEKDRQDGIEKLNGEKLKKEILTAKIALPAKDNMVQNERRSRTENQEPEKPDLRSTEEKLLDAVAPWRKISYQKQVQDKTDKAKSNCGKISHLLKQATSFSQSAVKWPSENYDSKSKLCFSLLDCVESKVIWDYRNKCEFTFGFDKNEERSVGFRIGRYKDKTIQVESAEKVPLLMPGIRSVLPEIADFIKNSKFAPYNPATYEGHWTTLTIRCSGTDTDPYESERLTEKMEKSDLVGIFIFTRNGISDEILETAKLELMELSEKSKTFTGIIFTWKEVRGNAGESTVISGTENITGKVLDKTFKISPKSFFQTHYHQCHTLYQLLGEWSTSYTNLENKKILLDICCGTGSIGIALESYFDFVFGVEMEKSAIEDANQNVELNGLQDKCTFILGKAEDKVLDICAAASQKEMEIVAIVDPPRGGLPKKVISVLRGNSGIESLVYVSCDSSNKLAQGNLVDLCRDSSNSLRGGPFRIVKCQPVDLFPHTPHFELVFLLLRGNALERWEKEKKEKKKKEKENESEEKEMNSSTVQE